MLKGLLTLLAQPGNAIIAGAGVFSTVMTVGVVTSGTEIVVEERAEAIVTKLNDELIVKHNQEIKTLEASKSELESQLADVLATGDPKNCDQNPSSAICIYIQKAIDAQKRALDEEHRLAQLAFENGAKNKLDAELAALTLSLNEQCEIKLSDQQTQFNTECEQKLALQERRLKREFEIAGRTALAGLAERHKAELAAQKQQLTEQCAGKLKAQSAASEKEVLVLKRGHAREVSALRAEIARLEQSKACRIQ